MQGYGGDDSGRGRGRGKGAGGSGAPKRKRAKKGAGGGGARASGHLHAPPSALGLEVGLSDAGLGGMAGMHDDMGGHAMAGQQEVGLEEDPAAAAMRAAQLAQAYGIGAMGRMDPAMAAYAEQAGAVPGYEAYGMGAYGHPSAAAAYSMYYPSQADQIAQMMALGQVRF